MLMLLQRISSFARKSGTTAARATNINRRYVGPNSRAWAANLQSSRLRHDTPDNYESCDRHIRATTFYLGPRFGEETTAGVVFLHGVGDTGYFYLRQMLELSGMVPWVRFCIPTADKHAVTMYKGEQLASWYDITGTAASREEEECIGLDESSDRALDAVDSLVADGIPRNRIVLAGFGQGGAVALWAGLRVNSQDQLAGVVCLAGYMPRAQQFMVTPRLDTKVLVAAGLADELVDPQLAKVMHNRFLEAGIDSRHVEYPSLNHTFLKVHLRDFGRFLVDTVPPLTPPANISIMNKYMESNQYGKRIDPPKARTPYGEQLRERLAAKLAPRPT